MIEIVPLRSIPKGALLKLGSDPSFDLPPLPSGGSSPSEPFAQPIPADLVPVHLLPRHRQRSSQRLERPARELLELGVDGLLGRGLEEGDLFEDGRRGWRGERSRRGGGGEGEGRAGKGVELDVSLLKVVDNDLDLALDGVL
jgi:hypothetical protein